MRLLFHGAGLATSAESLVKRKKELARSSRSMYRALSPTTVNEWRARKEKGFYHEILSQ
jgi:hypothetical protein